LRSGPTNCTIMRSYACRCVSSCWMASHTSCERVAVMLRVLNRRASSDQYS
jgi:hypothetical protein